MDVNVESVRESERDERVQKTNGKKRLDMETSRQFPVPLNTRMEVQMAA